MNATILVLAGYILWIMLLLVILATIRTAFSNKRTDKSLKFDPNGADLAGLGQRITRAHMNTVESFPFIGGVLLLAIATDSTVITNSLAFVLLAARIIQSCIHISSVDNRAITLRFIFFMIQLAICCFWLVRIIQKFV